MLIFLILAIVFIAFGAHGVWMVVNAITHPAHIVLSIALGLLVIHVARVCFDKYMAGRKP